MKSDVFNYALLEAKRELVTVEEKVAELNAERAKLQAVVAGLESYLSMVDSSNSPVSPPLQLEYGESARSVPAWSSARDVLADRKEPATVPQIHHSLEQKGIYLAKDALRVAMLRKPDIFVQIGGGLYGLTKYGAFMRPEEKEPAEAGS